ncbi:hypothetical protein ACFQ88_34375 [Paenibacillus sp. NPDC056579]|uniref:hypothetical protein n=1 Tax=unclassified Paenibacillus TaxID=185978 RepID=UPI001EF78218|nr:hypothetical protein [Paenibacillus sp. H1-7]ULL18926.1 hypothetical protein DVH26_33525 [Paenibacillus sp. H1-7]
MTTVYVSKNGEVTVAVGEQPKDALLFVSPLKSFQDLLKEQKEESAKALELIRSRFAAAKRG